MTFTPLYNPMLSASSQDELTMAEALSMCRQDSKCNTLHPTRHSQLLQMLSILWHDGAWMWILSTCYRVEGAFLPVFSSAF